MLIYCAKFAYFSALF